MANQRTLVPDKRRYYLRTFFWAFTLGFLVFIPWMIYNKGYFFFYGDFNVQQIPFYQMIHDSVRSGNLGWSYTTDLGANIIGSYSFYMLGSPFFWLTLPFPSEFVPYMMAPLLMLKYGFASLGAYTFLSRYVKNQNNAVIASLLYAFSGFGIYNVFFNHFHEAMITFPFMLAAVDAFIYDKRKGVLALSVFAASFVNYYFFAGQAVFIFIYWCVRTVTGSYRMTLKEFLRFAFEVIIGFMCSAVILVPSILAVIQNSRVTNAPNGWGALLYSSEQRYLHIFESFFFPPDMPAYPNFAPDSNAKWASVAAWLPLFSMVGVFSFYKLKTHKWLRTLVPILFVIAFVPVFNSIFQMLNVSYYARWFYMLTLMLSMMTALCLDHEETDFKPGLRLTFCITIITALLIGMMPNKTKDSSGNSVTSYGLEKYPDRFWVWVGIAVLGLILLTVLFHFRRNRKAFERAAAIMLSAMIVLYGNVLLGVGVVNAGYKTDYIINNAINNKDKFNEISDLRNVRSDFYNEMDNMGMFWQIPTIQAFQSIVPGSIMEFYKSVGVERSVGSRPETDRYAVRGILSCKYLFDNANHSKKFTEGTTPKMPGWSLMKEKNGYKVYKNDYFIPYGFTYDTYVTRDEYDKCKEENRSLLMLKSIVLTNEQAARYSDILEHDTKLKEYRYTQSEYYNDCNERKKLTCKSIKFEKNTVTAKIVTGKKSELVFFSIPYEDGWSATVNGTPVEIEKVNVGFMAVRVSGNTNSTIKFTYRTPGLTAGVAVSVISVIIFAGYLVIWKTPRKRREYGDIVFDDLGTELYSSMNDAFDYEIKEENEDNEDNENEENVDDNVGEPEVIPLNEDNVELTVIEESPQDEAEGGKTDENNPESGNHREKI